VHFGPLVAEIVSLVWGTPGNFNGFRVLAALLHGTLVVGVSKTVALNRGRHLYSAGRPSRWALAHILVVNNLVALRALFKLWLNYKNRQFQGNWLNSVCFVPQSSPKQIHNNATICTTALKMVRVQDKTRKPLTWGCTDHYVTYSQLSNSARLYSRPRLCLAS